MPRLSLCVRTTNSCHSCHCYTRPHPNEPPHAAQGDWRDFRRAAGHWGPSVGCPDAGAGGVWHGGHRDAWGHRRSRPAIDSHGRRPAPRRPRVRRMVYQLPAGRGHGTRLRLIRVACGIGAVAHRALSATVRGAGSGRRGERRPLVRCAPDRGSPRSRAGVSQHAPAREPAAGATDRGESRRGLHGQLLQQPGRVEPVLPG